MTINCLTATTARRAVWPWIGLLLGVLLVGCDKPEGRRVGDYSVIQVDGCEYIRRTGYSGTPLIHKANCLNHGQPASPFVTKTNYIYGQSYWITNAPLNYRQLVESFQAEALDITTTNLERYVLTNDGKGVFGWRKLP